MCTVLRNPLVDWYFARSQPIQEKWHIVNPESFTYTKQITMKDDRCNCPPVENIYPDEQKKLNLQEENEMELMLKVMDLLDDYGYELTAVLEDGVPVLKLSMSY